jgi:hypothetical protein
MTTAAAASRKRRATLIKLVTARDKPLRCVNTDEHSPDEGKPCESALRVDYGDDPMLPDIKLGWVDMLYRVRGGRDGGGFIEIYANNRFIARVTGPIGYKGGAGDRQYFKIGNYHNFIPGRAQLDFDIFWRGEEPPKIRPRLQTEPMKRTAISLTSRDSRSSSNGPLPAERTFSS